MGVVLGAGLRLAFVVVETESAVEVGIGLAEGLVEEGVECWVVEAGLAVVLVLPMKVVDGLSSNTQFGCV